MIREYGIVDVYEKDDYLKLDIPDPNLAELTK